MFGTAVDRAFDRIIGGIRTLLALTFVLAVALNFANVVGRYAFGWMMLGADEVQVYIMVAMTFLGAAVVSWRGEHLRMDVLARALPARGRAILRAAEMALVIALAGFAATQSIRYAAQMLALGRSSDNAGIPMWIPHGALAVGFGLIVLIAFWQGLRGAQPRIPGG